MRVGKWKMLSEETKFHNPWLTLVEREYKLADGRKTQWHIIQRPDAVCVFCLTKKGKVVAIRHYRAGIDRIITDLPTGRIDKGETPLQAAKRELKEETGFKARKFIKLGSYASNPSATTTTFHAFLALEGTRSHAQDLDESEEIEVKELTLKQLMQKIESKEFFDATRIVAVFLALRKLGKLKIRL